MSVSEQELLDGFAAKDKDGLAVLQLASARSRKPPAKMVLSHGTDLNARHEDSRKMVLHFAAGGGYEKVLGVPLWPDECNGWKHGHGVPLWRVWCSWDHQCACECRADVDAFHQPGRWRRTRQ